LEADDLVERDVTRLVAAALFVWAGLLLGVSFVATPAKFLAPTLGLAQAWDVGRWIPFMSSWPSSNGA
jgi:hypothetical protein